MFSTNQTETSSTTTSTEQITKSMKRLANKVYGQFSHKQYERLNHRTPKNFGRKRYDQGVLARMEAKRAVRLAKKQTNEPLTSITTTKSDVPTETAKFDETVVQAYVAIYGGTQVLTKKFGDRTVTVVFPKLDEFKPRSREVWQVENGKIRQLKASYGNKCSIADLEKSGWKWGILKECSQTLIRHLAGLPPSNELKAAA